MRENKYQDKSGITYCVNFSHQLRMITQQIWYTKDQLSKIITPMVKGLAGVYFLPQINLIVECSVVGKIVIGKIISLKVNKAEVLLGVDDDGRETDQSYSSDFPYNCLRPKSKTDDELDKHDDYKTANDGSKFLAYVGLDVMLVGHKNNYTGKIGAMGRRKFDMDLGSNQCGKYQSKLRKKRRALEE